MERLELGFFSLEKALWDLLTVFQYLKGSYTEDRGSLFSRSHAEKTRGNGYKLHQETFQLDTRKKKFTVRITFHWNVLPRDAAEPP